jgi:hypothetical protein
MYYQGSVVYTFDEESQEEYDIFPKTAVSSTGELEETVL